MAYTLKPVELASQVMLAYVEKLVALRGSRKMIGKEIISEIREIRVPIKKGDPADVFDKPSQAFQYQIPNLPAVLTAEQLSILEEIVIASNRATDCCNHSRMNIRLREDIFYVPDENHNAEI